MFHRSMARAALPLAAGLLLMSPAFAVDVVNQDDEDRQITITVGDESSELTLRPGDSSLDVCELCRLTLPNGLSIEAEGDDVVIIHEGKLSKSDS